MISLANVQKRFGDKTVLHDIRFDVKQGEFITILGPSGCGKSTLLRLVAGLELPSSGSMNVQSKNISFVFQEPLLLPWRTVLENVLLPTEIISAPPQNPLDRAHALLDSLGLKNDYALYPNQLSGGMKMRVSLARALMTDPDILLMDEPFSSLDEFRRSQLAEELRGLWARKSQKPMTILFVTHSIAEALYLGDRTLVFSSRPGTLLKEFQSELPNYRPLDLMMGDRFLARQREVSLLMRPESIRDGVR